jgi:hypothetical protein
MPSDAITADPPTIWPLYEGTKRLRATPMDKANYCALRGWTVPADEDPREPGYTVEYQDGGKPNVAGFDGYVSWSPADVFERSYHRIPISDGSKAGIESSLETTDRRGAEGAVAERVTLDDLKAKITSANYTTGDNIYGPTAADPLEQRCPPSLACLTICVLTLDNGFTVVGKSAPMSADNFDAAKGRQFAYEDAVRQMWPLEAYARLEHKRRNDRP